PKAPAEESAPRGGSPDGPRRPSRPQGGGRRAPGRPLPPERGRPGATPARDQAESEGDGPSAAPGSGRQQPRTARPGGSSGKRGGGRKGGDRKKRRDRCG